MVVRTQERKARSDVGCARELETGLRSLKTSGYYQRRKETKAFILGNRVSKGNVKAELETMNLL